MQKVGQVIQPCFVHQLSGALQLVGIAVDADDRRAGEASDLDERSANPAPEIGDDHSWCEPELVRQKLLVARQRCLEALTGNARGKVKRPAPAKLKEIRDHVIVEIVDRGEVADPRSVALVKLEAAFVFANRRRDARVALTVLE